MSYEGTPPPSTRRRMMPPTPQQKLHSLTDERQWQEDLKARRSILGTRERKVSAGMENDLDKGDDVKVVIEALELPMAQEDLEVCLRFFLAHARRRGSRIFEIFSTKQKKVTTQWQPETVGWSTKERGSRSKRGRKAI